MSELDLVERVVRMEAAEEIRHLIWEYATACDAADVTRLEALFAEEAVLRNPDAHEGRDAIISYYAPILTSLSFARHHVSNLDITVHDADHASYTAYFCAVLGRDGDSVLSFGNYRDTVVRRDGRWIYTEKVNEIVGVTTLDDGWGRLSST